MLNITDIYDKPGVWYFPVYIPLWHRRHIALKFATHFTLLALWLPFDVWVGKGLNKKAEGAQNGAGHAEGADMEKRPRKKKMI